MNNSTLRIWMWIQNDHLFKAISNQENGTLIIYDEDDNILLRRTGLTKQQVKKIEIILSACNCKKLDENKEPFTYL